MNSYELDDAIKIFIEKSIDLYDSIKEGNADKVKTIIDCKNCCAIYVFLNLNAPVRTRNQQKNLYLLNRIAKYLIANYTNFKAEKFEISKEILKLLPSNRFVTKVTSFLDAIDILIVKAVNYKLPTCIQLQLLKLAFKDRNEKIVDFFLGIPHVLVLHYVAFIGDIDAAKILIEKKVNLNVTNRLGYTPLYLAVMENHIEMVKLLIENGANINCKTLEKKLPLHLAIAKRSVEMVKILLESGANVNDCSEGKTPLHIAVGTGNKETVAGKKEKKKMKKRMKHLNIAVAKEHEEITLH